MKKDIRNTDAVACKLELVLIKATNQKLEVTKEEKRKKEEIMEKRKIEAIVIKY